MIRIRKLAEASFFLFKLESFLLLEQEFDRIEK